MWYHDDVKPGSVEGREQTMAGKPQRPVAEVSYWKDGNMENHSELTFEENTQSFTAPSMSLMSPASDYKKELT